MKIEKVIKYVKEHGNCYLKEMPDEETIKVVEKAVGFKVEIWETSDNDGFVIERKVVRIDKR